MGLNDELYANVRNLTQKSKKAKEMKLMRRANQIRRMMNTSNRLADYYARTIVENSCQQVISALGEKMLAVAASKETVELLGQLVAHKAYEAAQNALAGDVVQCKGLKQAFGRLSVTFTINKAGETKVSVKKKRSKKKKTATVPEKKKVERDSDGSNAVAADDDVEIDNATVITTRDGTKIVINNLNIYINVDNVQQLNVNPQVVQNILEDKLNKIIEKTGK